MDKFLSFVKTASAFLSTSCVGANAVSRADVCEASGLSKDNVGLISSMIAAGLLPGYKIRGGREGGVCREDAPEGPNPDKFDKTFLAQLLGTLAQHVPACGAGYVTRGKIAQEMGVPSGETEAKISRAISLKLCTGYAAKKGMGIYRLTAEEMAAAAQAAEPTVSAEGDADAVPQEAAPVEAAPATEPVVEPTVEAAPAENTEAPKSKGKGKKRATKK